MKLHVTPAASDVADGIRQGLGAISGVSSLVVTASGQTIHVALRVPRGIKPQVQDVIDSYTESGFGVVLDTRCI